MRSAPKYREIGFQETTGFGKIAGICPVALKPVPVYILLKDDSDEKGITSLARLPKNISFGHGIQDPLQMAAAAMQMKGGLLYPLQTAFRA